MKEVLDFKEIRVFSNDNKTLLMAVVNDFIRSEEYKVHDIKYGVSSGLIFTEYSVMLVVEENSELFLS